MKYGETQTTSILEMQLIFGKQFLEMVVEIDNNDGIKGKRLPFMFNDHKYKMTIEKQENNND